MALVTQRLTTPVNRQVQFGFGETVASYLVGVSRFELTYGEDTGDHWVQQATLTLTHSSTGTQVSVTANASMNDCSSHSLDTADSLVTITVLAWTGSQPDTLAIGPVTGLPNGSEGPAGGIAVPGTSTPIQAALMSGFDLSYGSSDKEVYKVAAGVSATVSVNAGYVLARGAMTDSSGNNASTATVDGWLLLASTAAPGMVVQTGQHQTANQVRVTFQLPQGQRLVDAAVFLTGFQAQYSGTNYWVLSVGAGVLDWCISSDDTVLLSNARAILCDKSDHAQDDSNSFAQWLVIGILGPAS